MNNKTTTRMAPLFFRADLMPENGRWRLAIIGCALIMSGCAYVPKQPLVAGPTSVEPAAMPGVKVTGSIYQASQPVNYAYQPLFEDRRPRHIGDTLTIILQEDVSASKNSSANASRKGKSGFSAGATPELLNKLVGVDKLQFDMGGENEFGGKGGANANNTFKGTITVTVTKLLANGNLQVVGEKQIAINQGTEYIRFSGMVNPRTISGSNTVNSTQVADARIEYVGDGYINEAQNMGWLQRILLNISPF